MAISIIKAYRFNSLREELSGKLFSSVNSQDLLKKNFVFTSSDVASFSLKNTFLEKQHVLGNIDFHSLSNDFEKFFTSKNHDFLSLHQYFIFFLKQYSSQKDFQILFPHFVDFNSMMNLFHITSQLLKVFYEYENNFPLLIDCWNKNQLYFESYEDVEFDRRIEQAQQSIYKEFALFLKKYSLSNSSEEEASSLFFSYKKDFLQDIRGIHLFCPSFLNLKQIEFLDYMDKKLNIPVFIYWLQLDLPSSFDTVYKKPKEDFFKHFKQNLDAYQISYQEITLEEAQTKPETKISYYTAKKKTHSPLKEYGDIFLEIQNKLRENPDLSLFNIGVSTLSSESESLELVKDLYEDKLKQHYLEPSLSKKTFLSLCLECLNVLKNDFMLMSVFNFLKQYSVLDKESRFSLKELDQWKKEMEEMGALKEFEDELDYGHLSVLKYGYQIKLASYIDFSSAKMKSSYLDESGDTFFFMFRFIKSLKSLKGLTGLTLLESFIEFIDEIYSSLSTMNFYRKEYKELKDFLQTFSFLSAEFKEWVNLEVLIFYLEKFFFESKNTNFLKNSQRGLPLGSYHSFKGSATDILFLSHIMEENLNFSLLKKPFFDLEVLFNKPILKLKIAQEQASLLEIIFNSKEAHLFFTYDKDSKDSFEFLELIKNYPEAKALSTLSFDLNKTDLFVKEFNFEKTSDKLLPTLKKSYYTVTGYELAFFLKNPYEAFVKNNWGKVENLNYLAIEQNLPFFSFGSGEYLKHLKIFLQEKFFLYHIDKAQDSSLEHFLYQEAELYRRTKEGLGIYGQEQFSTYNNIQWKKMLDDLVESFLTAEKIFSLEEKEEFFLQGSVGNYLSKEEYSTSTFTLDSLELKIEEKTFILSGKLDYFSLIHSEKSISLKIFMFFDKVKVSSTKYLNELVNSLILGLGLLKQRDTSNILITIYNLFTEDGILFEMSFTQITLEDYLRVLLEYLFFSRVEIPPFSLYKFEEFLESKSKEIEAEPFLLKEKFQEYLEAIEESDSKQSFNRSFKADENPSIQTDDKFFWNWDSFTGKEFIELMDSWYRIILKDISKIAESDKKERNLE